MVKLLRYIKDYKKECVLGPLFKLLEACFDLTVPMVMAWMIDRGIAENDLPFIGKMGLVLLLLALIGMTCSITAQYFAAKAATGFAAKLRHVVFKHIESLSFTEMDEIGTSMMITRMTSDINQVQSGTNMALRLFLRSPFIVVGAAVMAFTISVREALIFVVVIPLLACVIFGIMLLTMPMYEKAQGHLDRLLGVTRQNLSGVRVIRAFNKEEAQKKVFGEENDHLTKRQIFVGKISALMNPVTYIMINVALVVLIWQGAFQVDIGGLKQGQIVALINYMSQILVELVKFANTIILTTKCVACGNRIQDLLETESSIVSSVVPEGVGRIVDTGETGETGKTLVPGDESVDTGETGETRKTLASGDESVETGKPGETGKTLASGDESVDTGETGETGKTLASGDEKAEAGEPKEIEMPGESSEKALSEEAGVPQRPMKIEFRDVSFTYRGAGEASLERISFTAEPGQAIGIIGGTGSGKSSLVHLIPRFYDVSEGAVLVDGKDVRSWDLQELRGRVGIVMQKAVLFHGTIRENIRWGNPEATEEQMMEALRLAQAAEIVEKKEDGLDYQIEQGGRNLSGGQRQRLTIARALVRKPSVLILDDSASALDFATDARLRKGLESLRDQSTIFIVSQRTSSIQSADRILVMDDGMIVGMGTHEELMQSCEVYQEIYESQFKKDE